MTDPYVQLREQAARRPDAVAIVRRFAGGGVAQTTYGELAARAARFAGRLATEPEAARIIPLLLPRSAECVAAMFGALGAGRGFACLDRRLRRPQVERILSMLGATAALADAGAVATLTAGGAIGSDSSTARAAWHVVDVAGEAPTPPQARAMEMFRAAARVRAWSEDDKGTAPPPLAGDPARVVCCLFTSGSTGEPKGVLIGAADLAARAAAEVELFELTERDVLLGVLPFSFDVGLNQLMAGLAAGAAVVLSDSWLAADLLRGAAAHGVTGISAVPAVWEGLLNSMAAFDKTGPHAALRYVTVSGGDLPAARLRRLATALHGIGVYKTYGQSETFRSSALRPAELAERPTSVGRAFGSARVYVVHEDGTRCGPGEGGEIVHAGVGTMLGYLGGDSTGKVRPNPFHGPDDPNPLAVFTGDVGRLDAEGFLYVEGRRDAMLKVAGNRLYPQEVAAQLTELPGVDEAEAVGIKDGGGGGDVTLVAFCAVREATTDGETLRRLAAARLPSYMVPRHVVVVGALPRTVSGKVDRPALERRAAELFAGGKDR